MIWESVFALWYKRLNSLYAALSFHNLMKVTLNCGLSYDRSDATQTPVYRDKQQIVVDVFILMIIEEYFSCLSNSSKPIFIIRRENVNHLWNDSLITYVWECGWVHVYMRLCISNFYNLTHQKVTLGMRVPWVGVESWRQIAHNNTYRHSLIKDVNMGWMGERITATTLNMERTT